jgi:hypothetical protein
VIRDRWQRGFTYPVGILATLTIATFFVSTVMVEFLGSPDAVARVKSLIIFPGLWVLIPAIAATGGTGFALSKSRQGRLVDVKKRRMPFIAGNGLLILVPCAIFLKPSGCSELFSPWGFRGGYAGDREMVCGESPERRLTTDLDTSSIHRVLKEESS